MTRASRRRFATGPGRTHGRGPATSSSTPGTIGSSSRAAAAEAAGVAAVIGDRADSEGPGETAAAGEATAVEGMAAGGVTVAVAAAGAPSVRVGVGGLEGDDKCLAHIYLSVSCAIQPRLAWMWVFCVLLNLACLCHNNFCNRVYQVFSLECN